MYYERRTLRRLPKSEGRLDEYITTTMQPTRSRRRPSSCQTPRPPPRQTRVAKPHPARPSPAPAVVHPVADGRLRGLCLLVIDERASERRGEVASERAIAWCVASTSVEVTTTPELQAGPSADRVCVTSWASARERLEARAQVVWPGLYQGEPAGFMPWKGSLAEKA
jgi:hypothetical protein